MRRHLQPLYRIYGAATLGFVFCHFLYYNGVVIQTIPDHVLLHLLHFYFIYSGFHTIYPILHVTATSIAERIYPIASRFTQLFSLYLIIIPLKSMLMNNFHTLSMHTHLSIKSIFMLRLLNCLALFMWCINIETQATLLITILILLIQKDFVITWISYIFICIYIQYAIDPSNIIAITTPSTELLSCFPYYFIPFELSTELVVPPTLLVDESCDVHSIPIQLVQPSLATIQFFKQRTSPLHCQLPFIFIGGLFAYALHEYRVRATKHRHEFKHNITQREFGTLDGHMIQQTLATAALLGSFYWLYIMAYRYDALLSLLPQYDMVNLGVSLTSCIAVLYINFSFLVSKSNPCYNHYLHSLIHRLFWFAHRDQQSHSIFSIYFYIAHFVVSFEYIFIFDVYTVCTTRDVIVMTFYCIVVCYMLSSVFHEWVFKPFHQVGHALAEAMLRLLHWILPSVVNARRNSVY